MACHLLPHLSAVAIDVVLTRMIREGCRQLVEEIHFGGVQFVSELWGDGLLAHLYAVALRESGGMCSAIEIIGAVGKVVGSGIEVDVRAQSAIPPHPMHVVESDGIRSVFEIALLRYRREDVFHSVHAVARQCHVAFQVAHIDIV